MAGLLILLTLLGIVLCTSAGLGVDSRDPSFSLWPLQRIDPADAADTDTDTGTAGRNRTPAHAAEPLHPTQAKGGSVNHSGEVRNDQRARCALPAAFGTWESTPALRRGHRAVPH